MKLEEKYVFVVDRMDDVMTMIRCYCVRDVVGTLACLLAWWGKGGEWKYGSEYVFVGEKQG